MRLAVAAPPPCDRAHSRSSGAASPARTWVGHPATPAEISGWNIDVLQRRGLPPGQGSVREGEAIFAETCAACHGERGQGKPMDRLVGGAGTIATAKPVKTVGSSGRTRPRSSTSFVARCRSARRNRSRHPRPTPFAPMSCTSMAPSSGLRMRREVVAGRCDAEPRRLRQRIRSARRLPETLRKGAAFAALVGSRSLTKRTRFHDAENVADGPSARGTIGYP